jgi:hypothetical protein
VLATPADRHSKAFVNPLRLRQLKGVSDYGTELYPTT